MFPFSIIFLCVHQSQNHCITRKVENIQIFLLGKSFWRAGCRMLNNRGWMNPVTTLSVILSNYQFVSTINSTHGLAPHILPCYANFSVLHIDYTESEKLQQRTEYHRKVQQCNVQGNLSGCFSMTRYASSALAY